MFSLLYQKKAIADDGDCLMRRVNSKTRGGGVQIFFHAESEREKISVQNQLLAQKVCTKSLRFSSAVKSSAMVIIILHTHTPLSSFDACAQREYLLCVKVVIFFFEETARKMRRSPPRCKKEQFGDEDIFVGTAGDGGWL